MGQAYEPFIIRVTFSVSLFLATLMLGGSPPVGVVDVPVSHVLWTAFHSAQDLWPVKGVGSGLGTCLSLCLAWELCCACPHACVSHACVSRVCLWLFPVERGGELSHLSVPSAPWHLYEGLSNEYITRGAAYGGVLSQSHWI